MKLAPLTRAFDQVGITHELVHTGQHYDLLMSDIFFQELGLAKPAHELGVGSGTPEEQTDAIIKALRPILKKGAWDAVLVVGDVTSTAAATQAAVAENIPVIHVEAGLRSFNPAMAEERNRIFVDHEAQWLFTTEPGAKHNLLNEGVAPERIYEVGNVMVDTMHLMRSQVERSTILTGLGVKKTEYGVVTLHRAALMQDKNIFHAVWKALRSIAQTLSLIAPLHPRARALLTELALASDDIRITDPLGYADMQRLIRDAKAVWTDSGGLQEETTVYGVPCFTIREDTERPITIEQGTNVLVGCTQKGIEDAYTIFNHMPKQGSIPALWDGHAAERIANILAET
ncbi:UDP-N-acetylglucosamine 2-epimerase (non-hydrolyzing) [Patescibacteria group bacterium]|nr:UDP-N-acetylglucosamine 2-epimerase (non-hydrolyzing) [Patescibacteria group bacterium]